LVKERLGKVDCLTKGWMLDGFPRTGAQAQALEKANILPHKVVLLDVDEKSLVERVVGRRTDPDTGKIYHLKFNPPPPEVDVKKLIQRDDDTEEKCKKRVETYNTNLQAIIDAYSTRLRRIDGNRAKETIFADICKYLDE